MPDNRDFSRPKTSPQNGRSDDDTPVEHPGVRVELRHLADKCETTNKEVGFLRAGLEEVRGDVTSLKIETAKQTVMLEALHNHHEAQQQAQAHKQRTRSERLWGVLLQVMAVAGAIGAGWVLHYLTRP